MSCINIYHPDYIKLLSEIDDSINPFELPTLIRLYQKMNNTDKIPSVSEIYEIDNRTKSQERISQIQDIQGFKDFVQGKQFQKLTAEEKAKTIEQVTKEHRSIAALKDLSAKLAHRIGGKVEFENKTDVDWKGYNQSNTSVLNEAYMTPDTPFHEILAHPIIRAIKQTNSSWYIEDYYDDKGSLKKAVYDGSKIVKIFEYLDDAKKFLNENKKITILYQSLLKELETGKGKEVFEQVKRDYQYREGGQEQFEKQQEEAIVTLLGLMAADKLDKIKDKNLISLLKELLLQMSEYIKSLFTAKEIRISELNVSNLEFLTDKKIEEFIKSGKIKKEC